MLCSSRCLTTIARLCERLSFSLSFSLEKERKKLHLKKIYCNKTALSYRASVPNSCRKPLRANALHRNSHGSMSSTTTLAHIRKHTHARTHAHMHTCTKAHARMHTRTHKQTHEHICLVALCVFKFCFVSFSTIFWPLPFPDLPTSIIYHIFANALLIILCIPYIYNTTLSTTPKSITTLTEGEKPTNNIKKIKKIKIKIMIFDVCDLLISTICATSSTQNDAKT